MRAFRNTLFTADMQSSFTANPARLARGGLEAVQRWVKVAHVVDRR
jgi:hypothetical protein